MSDNKEFSLIWEKVLGSVSQIALEESDADFAEAVGLSYRGEGEWHDRLEKEFHHQRHNFKEQCYGKRKTNIGDPLLDARKIAAVLCQACLVHKAFKYDVYAASKQAAAKKSQLSDMEYTCWAVNNTLINYKFAYLASHSLVYLSLIADLLKKEESREMGICLNRTGHLFRYPVDNNCDTYDVNVIVGLARDDIKGKDLNLLLYAMLLYQNEMYTRACLKFLTKN